MLKRNKPVFVSKLLFALFLVLLITPLFFFVSKAGALTEVQVSGAQRAIPFCTTDRYWAAGGEFAGDYSAEEKSKIQALCETSNAAELSEACGSDVRDLDSSKFYVSDPNLFTTLCAISANFNDNGVGITTTSGNEVVDAARPDNAINEPGSSINTIVTQQKADAGCFITGAGVSRAPICSLSTAQIIEQCRGQSITSNTSIERVCNLVRDNFSPEVVEDLIAEAEVIETEDNTADVEQDSCNEVGGDFSFLLCPLLELGTEAIEVIDENIIGALEVKEKYYSSPEIRNAWSNIRDIAYILLIPVILVMVISTALGFNFVDAYTVKRAMPRLFFAVIFMALSFEICIFLIELTNNVGNGVGSIVAAPFGGRGSLELEDVFSMGENIAITGIVGVGFAGIIGAFVISALSLGIIVSYIGGAALFLLIIFALLTIREMIILFLIVLAPLAILAWIFPGNDKPWKLWWGTFSKLLMVFPIIVALLWVGRGFAKLIFVTDATGFEGVFLMFAKMIAYVGPFFFIPAAFKFAGGAFANLAGMVNDRSKGLFDRNRKYRSDKWKKNNESLSKGEKRWAGGNEKNFRGKLNKASRSGYAVKDGLKDLGATGYLRDRKGAKDATYSKWDTNEAAHIEEDKAFDSNLDYDDLSGLTVAVRSSDWGTLEEVLRVKYGHKGDIDAGMNEIKRLASSGNLRGALAKTFEMADDDTNEGGQAFKGDASFRDQSVQQMMALDRKYTKEAVDQTLLLKTMKGGTFYKSPEQAWFAANAATTDHNGRRDMNAMARIGAKGRAILMQAGRPDQGGANFGHQMALDNDIEKGLDVLANGGTYTIKMQDGTEFAVGAGEQISTEAGLRKQIGKKQIYQAIEQNGLAVFAHQSMKTGTLDMEENIVPMIQERLKTAYEAHGADSEQYKAEVAAAEGLWKSLGQTKPEAQKMFGQKVLGYNVDTGTVSTQEEQEQWQNQYRKVETQRAEAQQYKASGLPPGTTTYSDGSAIQVDRAGSIIVPEQVRGGTVRTEVGRFLTDGVYQNYSYQFTQAEQQMAAGAAAAAQQSAVSTPVSSI